MNNPHIPQLTIQLGSLNTYVDLIRMIAAMGIAQELTGIEGSSTHIIKVSSSDAELSPGFPGTASKCLIKQGNVFQNIMEVLRATKLEASGFAYHYVRNDTCQMEIESLTSEITWSQQQVNQLIQEQDDLMEQLTEIVSEMDSIAGELSTKKLSKSKLIKNLTKDWGTYQTLYLKVKMNNGVIPPFQDIIHSIKDRAAVTAVEIYNRAAKNFHDIFYPSAVNATKKAGDAIIRYAHQMTTLLETVIDVETDLRVFFTDTNFHFKEPEFPEFVAYQFTSPLVEPFPVDEHYLRTFPLGISSVSDDFDSEDNSELSILKASQVFLLERPSSDWVLAMNTRNFRLGFIPSDRIEFPNSPFGTLKISETTEGNVFVSIAGETPKLIFLPDISNSDNREPDNVTRL